jgi:hypothetical protein
MNNANTCTTPMDNRAKFKLNNSQALKGDIKWFQAAIGGLLFCHGATCHEHDSHDRLRPGGHASIRRY